MPVIDVPKRPLGVILHQEEPVPELPKEKLITAWILRILKQESRALHSIQFVFLNDESLLKLNQDHLQHETLTDIITFPYNSNPIEAEVYISVDRVRENAQVFDVPALQELLRVMAHGVLHLCGWNDKTEADSILMRNREDACLALIGMPHSTSSPV